MTSGGHTPMKMQTLNHRGVLYAPFELVIHRKRPPIEHPVSYISDNGYAVTALGVPFGFT
jgi:hypothetical protein